MAAKEVNLEMLQNVMNWAEENLTTKEVNNKLILGTDYGGKMAWQYTSRKGNLEVFKKVREWPEEKLTT